MNDSRQGIERRRFLAILGVGSLVPIAGMTLDGCSAAEVEADIQHVLDALPTAIQIAESVATIIGVVAAPGKGAFVTPTAIADITNWGGQIASNLKLAQMILTQYEAKLASAPASIIQELDAAVSVINLNLSAILNGVHVFDATVQAAVGVVVTSIDSVLLGLEAIIPAQAASQFPRTANVLLARRGRTLGAIKAQVPTARHLAKTYNAGVAKDFPAAVVPVPRLHFLGIPL